MSDRTTNLRYPRLVRRVQAVVIDGLLLYAAILLPLVALSSIEVHGGLKAFCVAALIFLLEPGLVATTGATIGHRLRGLRIQDASTGANLGAFRALLRFLTKGLLGWLSLIFILTTKRHQAIHDLASRSVVVLRDPARVRDDEALPERIIERPDYVYPSKLRRILVIVLYVLLNLIVFLLLLELLLSDACLSIDRCTSMDRLYENLLGYGSLLVIAAAIVLAWQCRLWGCRKKRKDEGLGDAA